MRRGGAGEQKIRFLFQQLSDALRAIENKTLPPKEQSAEERSAINAKLAENEEAKVRRQNCEAMATLHVDR
jgi:hypothetical protein